MKSGKVVDAYLAHWCDFRWALLKDLDLEVLIVLAATHLELTAEELVLKLWNRWSHLTVLVSPLVYSRGAVIVIIIP